MTEFRLFQIVLKFSISSPKLDVYWAYIRLKLTKYIKNTLLNNTGFSYYAFSSKFGSKLGT